ncbi:hypothetical protein VNO80_05826 [Phaseolus coccineus]|uniref:Uncharacterized protein n=1 Tax=Phaseolus coccineus TaxID=3886 RepID=A0AAN9NKS2_PHACN
MCIPLQLEEASKGIALIPNLRFINFSFLSFLNIWDHAIPLDSSFGGFYCFSCFSWTTSNYCIRNHQFLAYKLHSAYEPQCYNSYPLIHSRRGTGSHQVKLFLNQGFRDEWKEKSNVLLAYECWNRLHMGLTHTVTVAMIASL